MNSEPFLIDHESKGKYRSKNVAHILTGVATEDQLRQSIDQIVEDCEGLLSSNARCETVISLVKDRNGKSFGYAYVWFSDPRVLNLVTGREADGKDRYVLIDQPGWEPSNAPIDFSTMSWADIAESEECPQIRQNLPPLVILSEYNPSDEQWNLYGRCKNEISVEPGKWKITPTYADDHKSINVLFCGKVPSSITAQHIHKYLRRFVTDKSKKFITKSKNQGEDYPIVNLNQKGCAYITFDPSGHDAYFALKVCRYSYIPDIKGEERFLCFAMFKKHE